MVISDGDWNEGPPPVQAATKLRLKGVPTRLVYFPDENHWVLKPKNSIEWYDQVFGWMARWMGQGQPAPAATPQRVPGRPERG